MVLIYVMLAQSLVLVAGYSGMISLAHAAFFGLGAYTTAILSVKFGFPFYLNLFIAIILNGIIALAISKIALKTVDDYFIIVTLGIQVILVSLINNLDELTNGSLGIMDIPNIKILGIEFESKSQLLFLVLFFCLLIYLFLNYIIKSPFGLLLKGLNEDEIYTKSLGKDVDFAKIISFAIGAMLAAIPGVLYAHYVRFIDPTSFTLGESIFILSIVIIGGMRSLLGAALAASILVILPEALRFLGMPTNMASNMRQIIYGLTLVSLMMFRFKNFVNRSI